MSLLAFAQIKMTSGVGVREPAGLRRSLRVDSRPSRGFVLDPSNAVPLHVTLTPGWTAKPAGRPAGMSIAM